MLGPTDELQNIIIINVSIFLDSVRTLKYLKEMCVINSSYKLFLWWN
jgi:hypothetical protein